MTIDFSDRQPPFLGWGTSLCWWAHGVGGWDDAEIDKVVKLITDPEEGLGMSLFRYNIGGGDEPTHHHFRRWGDVPGFKASADAEYDWSADANQRKMLLKLRDARPDALFEAFSNSPPYWMTHSGCTAGATDGSMNLRQEQEAAFATYLVDVAKHYRDTYGIKWHTIEPFNEPDVDWWRAGKDQEGCHVPRDQQARMIRLVRGELDKAGMKDTLVSATDANNLDDGLKSLQSYDQITLDALGQINVHSYAGHLRNELRGLAAEKLKPLWQSESGPLWVGGSTYEQIMKMAHRITLDMNQMQPQAWLDWQVVAGGPWGCLLDHPDSRTITVGKKFHVYQAFTKHIRPGDQFVHVSGSASAVAAISKTRGEAVIVLVNTDKSPITIHAKLVGLAKPASEVQAVQTAEHDDYKALEPVSILNNEITLTIPAESVTRLLLRNVE